jgi:hypothetical protein
VKLKGGVYVCECGSTYNALAQLTAVEAQP